MACCPITDEVSGEIRCGSAGELHTYNMYVHLATNYVHCMLSVLQITSIAIRNLDIIFRLGPDPPPPQRSGSSRSTGSATGFQGFTGASRTAASAPSSALPCRPTDSAATSKTCTTALLFVSLASTMALMALSPFEGFGMVNFIVCSVVGQYWGRYGSSKAHESVGARVRSYPDTAGHSRSLDLGTDSRCLHHVVILYPPEKYGHEEIFDKNSYGGLYEAPKNITRAKLNPAPPRNIFIV